MGLDGHMKSVGQKQLEVSSSIQGLSQQRIRELLGLLFNCAPLINRTLKGTITKLNLTDFRSH